MSPCIYAWTYIYIYIYIYTYIHAYIHIHIYIHIHTYIHTYICMCVCVCVSALIREFGLFVTLHSHCSYASRSYQYVCSRMHPCVYLWAYVCVYLCMYVVHTLQSLAYHHDTYTCTYIHMSWVRAWLHDFLFQQSSMLVHITAITGAVRFLHWICFSRQLLRRLKLFRAKNGTDGTHRAKPGRSVNVQVHTLPTYMLYTYMHTYIHTS